MKNTLKKLLITGGDGYVGSNLVKYFTVSHQVFPSVFVSKGLKNEIVLDITDQKAVKKTIQRLKPEIVIHTAGLSSLVACEKEPTQAEKVNFDGSRNIISAIDERSYFIFLSSDYVFAGNKGNYKENDKAEPKTVYGKTKLMTEEYLRACHPNHLIIRTANIFGRGGNYFSFVKDSLLKKEETKVYNDAYYTPTYIDFLLPAVKELMAKEFKGVINIAGREKISRYIFAKEVARQLGCKPSLVKGIKLPGRSLISKDSSLNTELLQQTLNIFNPDLSASVNLALGNTIYPYFYFGDSRGELCGITSGQKWEEINYIESGKGCVRGNHYHKKTSEQFYIISGRIEVAISDLKGQLLRRFTVSGGDIVRIAPNEVHTFTMLTYARWINMLSRKMEAQNPDMYKKEY